MDGVLAGPLDYLGRIWTLRYFWGSLVRNDLRNRYKRSFLGIGWSLLKPLALTAVFCVVFGKLFNVEVEHYLPFLLIGLTTWQFLCESMMSGCFSFVNGGSYMRQQQIPLAIFPLRAVLVAAFHFIIGTTLAIIFTLILRGRLDLLALLSLIPGMALVIILGWLLAIMCGVIYTHFPDTNQILEIGLQIAFYVTPILIPIESIPDRGRLIKLIEYNPITSVLAMIRTPILDGQLPAMHHIVVVLVLIVVVGSIALFLLRKLERTLIFWI